MKKRDFYFSVHYSFLIMIMSSFFTGMTWLILMYFICLVLHEGVHGLVAKKLGYKIGKIKLLATGAVLEAESDEFGFSDEIKIALSAPLFNLVLSLLIVVFWWLVPESYNFTLDLCIVNLAIFAFNMLPIFPLDGGRVLLGFLSKRLERAYAVKITKLITIILSICLFLIFVLSLFFTPNFSIGLTSISLFIGGVTEDKNAVYKRNLFSSRKAERMSKRGVEIRRLYVSVNMPKSKLFKLLDARHYTIFVLVDENLKEVAVIRESELLDCFASKK